MVGIKACDLVKRYANGGVVALDGVSFAIEPGEAIAVIGPSGAGKTTLFRILTRTAMLDGGRVEIGGIDLYRASYFQLGAIRQKIGMVYQKHNLVGELSAFHNAAIGMIGGCSTWRAMKNLLFGASRQERARVEAALERVGLDGKAGLRAANLSGGEQQRVAIARILVQDPALILADEPVASIDPASTERIMQIFSELNRDLGKTIVCNLHDVETAKAYFRRIIGISGGRLAFDGSPAELDKDTLVRIYRGGRESFDENGEDKCICIERIARRGIGGLNR